MYPTTLSGNTNAAALRHVAAFVFGIFSGSFDLSGPASMVRLANPNAGNTPPFNKCE
jgi:hypothetical protein